MRDATNIERDAVYLLCPVCNDLSWTTRSEAEQAERMQDWPGWECWNSHAASYPHPGVHVVPAPVEAQEALDAAYRLGGDDGVRVIAEARGWVW